MSVTTLLAISLGAILTNNFIFAQFLGICPFMGVSKKIDTALGMGMAVTFVMAIASAACYAVNVLLVKLSLDYMQTVAFILVIAAIVQVVEMFLKKSVPALYKALGVYLPLITTNCAVLGVVLVNVQKGYNFLLIYEDGKVSIWKDGKKLSVYDSDNILDEDSLWNVPGYTNFKVGEEEAKVTIKMAVRQIPILYKGSNSYSYNSLYWIYRSLQNSHEAWRSLAISFCVGLVLLAAWFVLRRERRAADHPERAEEGAVRGRSSHRQSDLPYLDGAALPCGVPVPALPDGSHAGGG